MAYFSMNFNMFSCLFNANQDKISQKPHKTRMETHKIITKTQ